MDWKNKSLISIRDLNKKDIEHVLKNAKEMEQYVTKPCNLAKGKVLASLFFEPSTRTRLSFNSAMERLGGGVIGFGQPKETSVSKGETLVDTIEMTSRYSDIIAMRHPLEGSARIASEVSNVPVINGGDGPNQHPTQTLLDLYTIKKRISKLDGLKIAMVGDLKYGRTVHSLSYALAMFNNVKLTFVSPPQLAMPSGLISELKSKFNTSMKEDKSLTNALKNNDIVYMTRIQQERFPDPQEYEQLKGAYVLTKKMIDETKSSALIMHPLPRVDEISLDVDKTENAIYFEQARNGIPVRMAIIGLILGVVK